MMAFYVDYNVREVLPDGGEAVAIRVGFMNPDALQQELRTGLRIILYDEGDQYEGILRYGWHLHGWVADIVSGTNKPLSQADFERLRRATLEAARTVGCPRSQTENDKGQD